MCSYCRSSRSCAFYHDQHLLHDPVRPHKVRAMQYAVNGSQTNATGCKTAEEESGGAGGGVGLETGKWHGSQL